MAHNLLVGLGADGLWHVRDRITVCDVPGSPCRTEAEAESVAGNESFCQSAGFNSREECRRKVGTNLDGTISTHGWLTSTTIRNCKGSGTRLMAGEAPKLAEV